MKTIFLASGKSSRMEPLGDKNLLEFCGKPFFLHLLENARNGGLDDFIVVTNKENSNLIAEVLQKEKFPAEIVVQPNLEEGQAGGVLAGLEKVANDGNVFILGGNDVVDETIYSEILEKSKDYDGGILAKKVKQYFPGGYLQVDGKNTITSIVEKPGEGTEPSDLVNVVTHYFKNPHDLKIALENLNLIQGDAYEQALEKLFKTKKFVAVEYSGLWQAIKYPWHVLEAMKTFLDRQESSISPKAEIADSARIKGDRVVVADGAKVFENAVIQGPCYIGKGAIVGNNALVRNSILGAKSVAGYNTEIARSFLSPNVTTHLAYVGDSVVDEGVNFGAFSCTANLRLDHKTVRVEIKDKKIDSGHKKLGAIVGRGAQIGIHAKLMPGAKLPQNNFVPPGEIRK